MNTVFDFFRLIRWLNLAIIILTQYAAAWCLSPHNSIVYFFELRFTLFVTGTVLIAAAGYILNDYMDVKLDLVNKPDKVVIGNTISRRRAMIWHSVFNGTALLIGVFLSIKIATIFLFSELLLWTYSSRLKRKFFSGNFAVAVLTAVSILVLPVFDASILWRPIIAYAVFAFLLTLIREIVKDMEDMKGDAGHNCETLPIVLGLRPTKQIIRSILLLLMLAVLAYAVREAQFIGWFFFSYGVITVLIPMIYLLIELNRADKKKDFSRLSTWCKVIMFTGIFSMLFFKIIH